MDIQDIRGKTPDEVIEAVSKDSGIPEQIYRNMYEAETSSGRNVKTSSAGAEGHMQIMGRELGVMRQTYGEDLDPQNFTDAMFMAGKMMKENLQHFGSISKAVAAYNGGWTEERWGNPETSAYVNKVLAGTGIDMGDIAHVIPQDVRTGQQKPVEIKPYLNDLEKNAIQQGMLADSLGGVPADQSVDAAVQLNLNPEAAYQQATVISQKPLEATYANADTILQDQVIASQTDAERAEGLTFGTQAKAAFDTFSLTGTLLNAITDNGVKVADAKDGFDADWIKRYEADRPKLTQGLSPSAVSQLDRSINEQEAMDIMVNDKRDQVNQQILNDSGHPILWGLTAGLLDPAGMLVGAGVGKAFQIGKSVSMAARIARGAAGGAAGNIAVIGGMDALGAHITPEDYIHAGAFGLVLGGGIGALSRGERAGITTAAQDMHEAAAARSEAFVNQAVKERYTMHMDADPLSSTNPDSIVTLYRGNDPANPNTNAWWTTDRAKAEAYGDVETLWLRSRDVQAMGSRGHNGIDEVYFSQDPHHAAVVPDAQAIGERARQLSEEEIWQRTQEIYATPARESQVFKPQEMGVNDYARIQQDYGMDTLVDEHQLSSVGSLMKSAEDFQSKNGGAIRTEALDNAPGRKIGGFLGWISSGYQLMTDKNPLARTLGMVIAEDGAGISGYRGMTAAIKSRNLGNMFNHNIEHGLESNFQGYLRDQGVGRAAGALETFTTGRRLQQFYREVATEIRNRQDPEFKSAAPRSVQQAANTLEHGFQRMGDMQRSAKTLGNEFLPTNSRGYLPQQLNGKAFRTLSASERRQVQQEFERQAKNDFGWDAEFATKKVAEYMNRASDFAIGGGRGVQGSPKDLMSVLLDDLSLTSSSPAEYMAALERIRAGAAKHTGKRLEWDLNANITRDDGSLMKLGDLYNNDVLSLYKGYANRVSGDVAMAHFGIYGDRDINLITQALQRSTVGDAEKTIGAWHQVVNEVYNRPTATDAGGPLSTTARFIRQYTGIRLLGGVGFAQMAELSNSVAHLGVANTIRMLPQIPGLFKEVRMIKNGQIPENSILGSLDMISGAPMGAEQYQMLLPQVIDGDLSIVDQRSLNNVMRTMGGAQLIHNKFSFMRAVTALEQRMVSEEILRKAFRYMNSGKEDVALREMGFTPELTARLKAIMPEIAQFDERGYLKALNAFGTKDSEAIGELVTVLRRGTGQIIQETFPGETGKWMRSEIGQLLMQFRKFPSVAIEKQYMRQYQKFGFSRALGGSLAAMGFGTMLYYGRAMVAASLMDESARKKYLDDRLDPASVANGALMYVSNFGMFNDFMQLGTGVGNMVDDSMDLGWSNSRGVPSQGIGGVIPSLGTLGDFYNFTQAPSTNGALKMLPFTNLPMVLPAINALKHADDD